MDIKVAWHKKLTFTGASKSGFNVPLGVDQSVGGDNDGFLPMELIALGLAGCTAMDVISILSKKRQEITSFEVAVHANRATEHPKVFTNATIAYHVTGHQIDEAAVLRSIELSATRYCPAQAMFTQIIPIELKYFIYEEEDSGERGLVNSGVFNFDGENASA